MTAGEQSRRGDHPRERQTGLEAPRDLAPDGFECLCVGFAHDHLSCFFAGYLPMVLAGSTVSFFRFGGGSTSPAGMLFSVSLRRLGSGRATIPVVRKVFCSLRPFFFGGGGVFV